MSVQTIKRVSKTIFILGDRSFTSAKVKCIKDYVKVCIRENNPDHVIMHMRTNELNFETSLERIAKSVADFARNIK